MTLQAKALPGFMACFGFSLCTHGVTYDLEVLGGSGSYEKSCLTFGSASSGPGWNHFQ